jgi:hypothetical protein
MRQNIIIEKKTSLSLLGIGSCVQRLFLIGFPSSRDIFIFFVWKVADSIPGEVNGFFNLLNLYSCTVFYSASNRNEYQNSTEGKRWPARKADTLSTICELIVQKMWDP